MCATSNDHYDLVVIGGGPAGFAGAVRGWDLGKKVRFVKTYFRIEFFSFHLHRKP